MIDPCLIGDDSTKPVGTYPRLKEANKCSPKRHFWGFYAGKRVAALKDLNNLKALLETVQTP
jgi:hypothetical protein